MPAGDGKGPNGAGPMTGRGAGFCAGYSAPGYANSVRGGGFQGYGYGCGGRGWRNRFYAAPNYGRGFYGAPYPPQYPAYEYSAENELKMLKEEADAINGRIRELEAAAAAKTDK